MVDFEYYIHHEDYKSYVNALRRALKPWLQERWRRDNHAKYQQYFEPWFENLTDSQLYYFEMQMEHIKNGSLTSWITKN